MQSKRPHPWSFYSVPESPSLVTKSLDPYGQLKTKHSKNTALLNLTKPSCFTDQIFAHYLDTTCAMYFVNQLVFCQYNIIGLYHFFSYFSLGRYKYKFDRNLYKTTT